MLIKTCLRLILFNLLLVIVNVLCFSEGFFGFSVNDNRSIIKALSITVIVMDVLFFLVVNSFELMQFMRHKEDSEKKKEYDIKDYVSDLKKYQNSNSEIGVKVIEAIEQLISFEEKQHAFAIVMQRNNKNYRSLNEEVSNVKKVLCDNARKILNELTILKVSERKRRTNPAQIQYLDEILQDSREILLKLDEFLEAVSRMDDKELSEYLTLEDVTKFLRQESAI